MSQWGQFLNNYIIQFYKVFPFLVCSVQLTVLVGDNLPELGPDLVAALASLDVDNLSHCVTICKAIANLNGVKV